MSQCCELFGHRSSRDRCTALEDVVGNCPAGDLFRLGRQRLLECLQDAFESRKRSWSQVSLLVRPESLEQIGCRDLTHGPYAQDAVSLDARLDMAQRHHRLCPSGCCDLFFLALAARVYIRNPPAAAVFPLKHSVPFFSSGHGLNASKVFQYPV